MSTTANLLTTLEANNPRTGSSSGKVIPSQVSQEDFLNGLVVEDHVSCEPGSGIAGSPNSACTPT